MEPCDADRRARWLLRIRASEHARIKKMPIRRLLAVGLPLFAALVVPTLAGAAPGDRDRSFGRNGRVITAFRSGSAAATSTVIDSRGRIIAAGWAVFQPGTPAGTMRFALARYKRSGRVHASFGGDGRVTTDLGGYDVADSVAVDSLGRIVVAGRTAT